MIVRLEDGLSSFSKDNNAIFFGELRSAMKLSGVSILEQVKSCTRSRSRPGM